jgi:hypothetical protein
MALERQLRADGLTLKPFRLEGIISAARLLNRPAPFDVRTLNKKRFVVAASYPHFGDIAIRARRRVRRDGMASVTACLGAKPNTPASQREAVLIEEILSSQQDFQWLDQSAGWFWFTETTRNRAVSRIRKMLAVASPLTLGEIGAGLARMKCQPLPEGALTELYRQIPGLIVTGNTVVAEPALKIDELLNKTEQDIFRLLSEHGGCLSSSELILRSKAIGVKRPTFYQCVTYSPIVARHNQGQYRLIGALNREELAHPGAV